jgi:chromosome partitioning protein
MAAMGTAGDGRTNAVTRKIVVLNPKGGSGKTTVAINLAAFYASVGQSPTLMDFDPQGSSTRWLKKRLQDQPPIHGIAAYEKNARVTRTFLLRVPAGTQRVVVDTPAAVPAHDMPELVKGADAILVPVLPSDIDIHACSKCISDLLLVAKVRRNEGRIGVVANRVRRNTVVFNTLMRFLATLQIPVITTLRDSQNYVRAAELGYGIHEMKPYLVREDTDSWQPLIDWLETRPPLGVAATPVGTVAAAAPAPGAPGIAGTQGTPTTSAVGATAGSAALAIAPLAAV